VEGDFANAAERRDADGGLLFTAVVVLKATDRRRYERQLVDSRSELRKGLATERETAELREQFIAVLGHDLRNPLAAIYGGAEIMVDSEIAPPQLKRLAGNIYRASRRIQELLQDLVNVGRGKTEGAEMCRLSEVAAAARDSLAPAADAQSVRVTVDIQDSIELPLERARVERVFINLIDNAIEAMEQGGAVRISASLTPENVTIEVADNGPGISPDIRDHLFQPFVSAGKKNGLGLGLALSRQTVLDHGGDMWVESAAGRGARFFIRLPLSRAVAHTEPAAASPVGSL